MAALGALKFYETLAEQAHRRPWAEGYPIDTFRLPVPKDKLIPFAIKKTANNTDPITEARLFHLNSTFYYDIFPLISASFDVFTDTSTTPDEHWHIFYGLSSFAIPADIDVIAPDLSVHSTTSANFLANPMYLWVNDGTESWYSEIFFMKAISDETPGQECGYVKLQYTHTSCRLGELPYDLGTLGLVIYLDADLGRPKYSYKVEAEEDGRKEPTTLFNRMDKSLDLEVYIPEYMADAMSLIPLHKILIVTDRWGITYLVKSSSFSIEWEQDGAFGTAVLTLNIENAVATCC